MYKINTENIGDVKKYVYYYRKGNKECGPFTYEDIVDLVKKGEIGPDDYVLKFGNRKFIKASEMKEIFDVNVQQEQNREEQMENTSEEPVATETEVKEETKEEIKEVTKVETKDDFHIVFDNMRPHVPAKHKKEPMGLKIALIIAGIIAACLTVWGISRIL